MKISINKVEMNEADLEEARFLANLKRMIQTANKAAERKNYNHGEIELGAIKRARHGGI